MSDIKEEPEVKESVDAVLEEVWAIKDQLWAECGHDVSKLFARARERQKQSGRPAVNLQRADDKPLE